MSTDQSSQAATAPDHEAAATTGGEVRWPVCWKPAAGPRPRRPRSSSSTAKP